VKIKLQYTRTLEHSKNKKLFSLKKIVIFEKINKTEKLLVRLTKRKGIPKSIKLEMRKGVSE
jgi:hypothetical protein